MAETANQDNVGIDQKYGNNIHTKVSSNDNLKSSYINGNHLGKNEGSRESLKNGCHSDACPDEPVNGGDTTSLTVEAKANKPGMGDLLYSVDDNPPWALSLMLGFQHYLTAFGSTLSVPLILSKLLCMGDDNVGAGELIATTFFMSGVTTLLQALVGVRLPIIQGVTFAFLAPTTAILQLPKWSCPSGIESDFQVLASNVSQSSYISVENGWNVTDPKEIWQSRIRELQGAICIASLFQVLIGMSGMMSIIVRYIGPLTVTPTITLIGLCLFEVAAEKASSQWWIAVATLVLIALFCQYMQSVTIPVPSFSCKSKKCSIVQLPAFKLFPILLAMLLSWFICFVLTITNVLPEKPDSWGFSARTDVRSDVITDSRWVRIPYPGQWGTPTVSPGAVFGMLAGVLASIMESVADYYACARLSGAPPPPPSAVNRGILMEGIGCVLAGVFGTGNGTTSYSENVGAIGITKVGSRRVVIAAGGLLLVMGCVGKVGALFVTIPDPVVGGMFIAMFGMIVAVGLSNLQFVDLRSSRNLFVLAFSIFIGLCLPHWVSKNRGIVDTGSDILDQILTVLLSTNMFVAGFIGFLLDSTLPGTLEERGIIKWRAESEETLEVSAEDGRERNDNDTTKSYPRRTKHDLYDFPQALRFLNRLPYAQYLPICPASDWTHEKLPLSQDDTKKEVIIMDVQNKNGNDQDKAQNGVV